MAKLSCASHLLLLLAAVHTGSALSCYESMCLSDLTTCMFNNKTVVKVCNTLTLTENLSKLQAYGGFIPDIPPSFTWSCATHKVKRTTDRLPKVDLRMCFPYSANVCSQVAAAARGVQAPLGQQLLTECNACTSDNCNPAQRPAASCLAALVAVATSLLLLRR